MFSRMPESFTLRLNGDSVQLKMGCTPLSRL